MFVSLILIYITAEARKISRCSAAFSAYVGIKLTIRKAIENGLTNVKLVM